MLNGLLLILVIVTQHSMQAVVDSCRENWSREAERLEGRLGLPIEVTFLPKYTWTIYPITSASYNLNLTSNALYTCLLGTRQTIYVACLLYEEHFMMQYGALLRRCVHSLL